MTKLDHAKSEPGPHFAMGGTGNDSQINTPGDSHEPHHHDHPDIHPAAGAQIAHAADPTDASLRHVKVLFQTLT